MAFADDEDAPQASLLQHLSTGRLSMLLMVILRILADRLGEDPRQVFDDIAKNAGLND